MQKGPYRQHRPGGKRERHGMSADPTYHSWAYMIQRCTNPKKNRYYSHGGRGIQVCKRWRESFLAFLEDMGPRPEGKTLDRWPDKDGNYEPGNCRWATPLEQAHNKHPHGYHKRHAAIMQPAEGERQQERY